MAVLYDFDDLWLCRSSLFSYHEELMVFYLHLIAPPSYPWTRKT